MCHKSMTFTEVERHIVQIRAMLNFIRVAMTIPPGSFIYCQAWVDDCPRALDWCEAKIKELLAL